MGKEALDRWKWKISRGSSEIAFSRPVAAAPMAGANDVPARMLLHSLGSELSFTEMISARALFEGAKRTELLTGWVPPKGAAAAQVFGADPEYLSFAAAELVSSGYRMIDLNAGCPKRKVTRTGAGGALLKDHALLLGCTGALLDSVRVPVGVKMRSGWSSVDIGSLKQLIKDLEGIGASYVAMHPRTVSQQYAGKADRSMVDIASSLLEIPIMASGDAKSPQDVMDYIGRGAKCVLVGRGALGDPTWYRRCMDALNDVSEWEPRFPVKVEDIREHLSLCRQHLRLSCGWYGEERGVVEFRSHLGWYVRRFRGRAAFRDRMYRVKGLDNAISLIDEMEKDWSRSALSSM